MKPSDSQQIKPGDSIQRISALQPFIVTANDGRFIHATYTVKVPVAELTEWNHKPARVPTVHPA